MRHEKTVGLIAMLALASLGPAATAASGESARVVHQDAASGSTFELDGISGTIAVTGTGGRSLTVDADVVSDSDHTGVAGHVRVERSPGAITVCTVDAGERTCGHGHHTADSNDTRIDYAVGLPEGVALTVRNIDGTVAVRGLKAPIDVATVNGDLSLDGDRAITAKTVNGKIEASVRANRAAPCSFATIDGSVSLRLRPSSDATVSARTLNGDIEGEGHIALADRSHSFVGHNATGTVGDGSGSVSIQTLNGSVHVVAE